MRAEPLHKSQQSIGLVFIQRAVVDGGKKGGISNLDSSGLSSSIPENSDNPFIHDFSRVPAGSPPEQTVQSRRGNAPFEGLPKGIYPHPFSFFPIASESTRPLVRQAQLGGQATASPPTFLRSQPEHRSIFAIAPNSSHRDKETDRSDGLGEQGIQRKAEEEGGATMSRRRSEHYRIEHKTWIPHERVVDPEEKGRKGDLLDTLLDILNIAPKLLPRLEYEYHSSYAGDDHKGYDGSYRVLSIMEFDWDGRKIINFSEAGEYGITHRHYSYKLKLNIRFAPDITLKKGKKTEKARANRHTNAYYKGKSFHSDISSENPLTLAPDFLTPNIDSDLSGSIGQDGNVTAFVIRYRTDEFPSHGVRIFKNGSEVMTKVFNDASDVHVKGYRGAASIGKRLSSQKKQGSMKFMV